MGRIVFTANQGTAFNIPPAGPSNQQVNPGIQITTNGGTGPFSGANGWINSFGISNVQPFRFDIPANSPAGQTRSLNLRFNNFTLVGNCLVCGQTITLNSHSTDGGYPVSGIGNNAGAPQAQIQGGALYGQQEITGQIVVDKNIANIGDPLSLILHKGKLLVEANELTVQDFLSTHPGAIDLGGSYQLSCSVSFEANSNGLYTITIDIEDREYSPCCCSSSSSSEDFCSCETGEPKVWVTFNGVTKALTMCDSESWLLCGSSPQAAAYGAAETFYLPIGPEERTGPYMTAGGAMPTALRVTLSSGYNSLGNCSEHIIIGAGTTWTYEYALDSNYCPIGEPTLISEEFTDNTNLCDEPGVCCNKECWGVMPSPSLSLQSPG